LKKFPKKLEELRQYALEVGADRAIILSAKQLEIRHSARAKCYIPACKFYGSSIMCPPHNLEFPEFLDVFFSNPLKLFTEVEIRMLGRAFFGGDEDS